MDMRNTIFKVKYLLLFSFLVSSILYSQNQLTYVESSQGLGTPALEGGRTELEFADVNNDGHLDILSIGDHGSPYINTQEHGVMVWFGDGMGNWSVFQYGDFGYGGIAVGDVNNDGFLDVGYGMHHDYSGNDLGDQLLEVALGDGTGMLWTPWDDGLATNGENWGMFGTDFADIDNDGDLDIGSNSFGSGAGVHVYINNMDGTWNQTFGFLGGNSTDDFVFGDINNDGFPDLAVAHQYGTVYVNEGNGNFFLADGNLPTGGLLGRRGPDLGDVDNDGADELSFCNSNGGVEIWKWSNGNNWTLISSGLPASGGYEATQIYDMDMDSFADIAAFGDGVVSVWKGNGFGSWSQMANFTLPSPGDFQAFRIDGDPDHNGYPDIALVDEEGSFINYQNHLRFFKETSARDSLSIKPVAPGPNRYWHTNSIQTIRWISEVPLGDTSWVKIEISRIDTLGPWHLIAHLLPNNGHYQWQVPDSLASNEVCRIRYTVYSQMDSAVGITPSGFYIGPVSVKISDIESQLRDNFLLLQNFPNPFNPATTIQYYLPTTEWVTLKIYDLYGRQVTSLINNKQNAGNHQVQFDGALLSSGVYVLRVNAGGYSGSRKIVLLK